MIRFPLIVIGVTALAALLTALLRPGQPRAAAGVAIGMAVAGGFTSVAVALFGSIRKNTPGPEGATRMLKTFVGLMAARMVGYLALIIGTVILSPGDAVSVGIGLVAGTVVFQGLEVLFLRKLT